MLWLDSAKEYRKLYHGKRLTLLVNGNWYDLAKSLPYWDEVVPLDTIRFRINPIYRLKFLIWLRKKGFEIIICPRHSVKLTLEPPIVGVSGATQKIVCEGSFPIEKENYFTHSIQMYPEKHELSRNAQFLRGLGRPRFKSTVPKINLSFTKGNHIVICPSSFRKRKEWPLENYIEIMKRLGLENVYVSSDKHIDNLPRSVYDFTGSTNIMEFIELIATAKLVIANDSAPIHLAAAFDVPSICIGAENPGRFFPYEIEKSRDGIVLPKLIYKPNVKDIAVDEVLDIVKGLIQCP